MTNDALLADLKRLRAVKDAAAEAYHAKLLACIDAGLTRVSIAAALGLSHQAVSQAVATLLLRARRKQRREPNG